MKTPRVKDFDPDAKAPTLKSSMDNMPAIGNYKNTPPSTQLAQTQNSLLYSQKKSQISDIPTGRPGDVETARPTDRATGRGELIRRGFEWYADQLRALKKLSLEEQLDGKPGSMSAMVRDALDEYLQKRTFRK